MRTAVEMFQIDQVIRKLYNRRVMSLCAQEPGQFLSPVFSLLEKAGSRRLI